MIKLICILLALILNIKGVQCQKRVDKPIEFSFFYATYFSYSKLQIKHPDIYSHAYFNSSDFGLKIQRKLTYKHPKLLLCAMYGGANLSVSGKSEFKISPDSLKPGQYQTGAVLNKTILPRYTYFGVGLKKLVRDYKSFGFNVEVGTKLFIKLNSDEPNISDITPINNDRFIFRTFAFEKKRKYTVLPYLAAGMDYKIGRFMFGIQLWVQNGFTRMYQFDYKLKYGSLNYESKLYSTGLAWGTNVYVKLFAL